MLSPNLQNGEFSLIHEAHNSLIGKFYSSVTLLLGMRPNEHEYKVMGLAPYASEYQKKVPREIFLNALSVDGMDFVKNPEMKDFYFYFKVKLKLCRFDGIAGGLQDFVELRLVEWFQNIIESTQIKDVVYNKDFLTACLYCNGRDYTVAEIKSAQQTRKPLQYKRI